MFSQFPPPQSVERDPVSDLSHSPSSCSFRSSCLLSCTVYSFPSFIPPFLQKQKYVLSLHVFGSIGKPWDCTITTFVKLKHEMTEKSKAVNVNALTWINALSRLTRLKFPMQLTHLKHKMTQNP